METYVCIANCDDLRVSVTEGKRYEAHIRHMPNSINVPIMVTIIDDTGLESRWNKDYFDLRFIPLNEWRDKKLGELGIY